MTDNVTNVDLFAVSAAIPPAPTEVSINDLVGADKKYKTPDDLAKALLHAQTHIDRVEAEQAALRQELQTRTTLEEFMTKVSSQEVQQRAVVPDPVNVPPATTGLTEEKVMELFQAQEQKKARSANAAHVQSELARKFGSDYMNSLSAKAQELGLSPSQVNEMAQTSPKATLALFGVTNSQTPIPSSAPPVSSMTTRPNGSSQDRDSAFYRNLLKTDPKTYWDPKTLNQMHDDALRLGANFNKR